jgi:hypothetical protein
MEFQAFAPIQQTNKQTKQNKQKPHPIYIQNSYMNYAEYQSGTNYTILIFNFEFELFFLGAFVSIHELTLGN